MSTVFLQVGQCGNQLGYEFWTRAVTCTQWNTHGLPGQCNTRHCNCLASSPLFDEKGYARCVLLDAEPKVIATNHAITPLKAGANKGKAVGRRSSTGSTPSRVRATPAPSISSPSDNEPIVGRAEPASLPSHAQYPSIFRKCHMHIDQYGRGNNWALGYRGRVGCHEGSEGSLAERGLSSIRQEAERCDVFTSIVMFHSLGGGTGAGLGSRMVEEMRDLYPKQFLLTCSVAPFPSGDTPLQHYNSLLTLSHLQEYTDGILLFNNADVAKALSTSNTKHSASATPLHRSMSFQSLNSYIAGGIADMLAPLQVLSYYSTYTKPFSLLPASTRPVALAPFPIHELISSVCPLPSNKLMEIWSSSGLGTRRETMEGKQSWSSLADCVTRAAPKPASKHLMPKVLSYALFARGPTQTYNGAADSFDRVPSRLQSLLPGVSWNPSPAHSFVSPLPAMSMATRSYTAPSLPAHPFPRSFALVMNRTRVADYVADILERAQSMYDASAYLHWYARYGCEQDEFQHCFQQMQTVVDDYYSAE